MCAEGYTGALCGACAVFGGAWSPWFLSGAWAALLSIDGGPSGCVYPWDSLLLEGGFLATFLPATHSLAPVLAAAAAAIPPKPTLEELQAQLAALSGQIAALTPA